MAHLDQLVEAAQYLEWHQFWVAAAAVAMEAIRLT